MRCSTVALLFAVVAVVMFAACASSDGVEVNRRSCERYLDHVVGLRFRNAEPSANDRDHRVAMKRALGDSFIASCEQLTSAQLECGLRASDPASAAACTASASK